jgi:hypothetical protein
MASDQKFSDWYFTFCEAHNRTPSQEEVWNAALAQPAPVQAGAQQAAGREPFVEWQWKFANKHGRNPTAEDAYAAPTQAVAGDAKGETA